MNDGPFGTSTRPARRVRSLRPCSGGAAYLLTRGAARRLIERAGTLRVPVDDFIWSQGLHGCDIAHLSPWLVMQSGAASTMVAARVSNRRRRLGESERRVILEVSSHRRVARRTRL